MVQINGVLVAWPKRKRCEFVGICCMASSIEFFLIDLSQIAVSFNNTAE